MLKYIHMIYNKSNDLDDFDLLLKSSNLSIFKNNKLEGK